MVAISQVPCLPMSVRERGLWVEVMEQFCCLLGQVLRMFASKPSSMAGIYKVVEGELIHHYC